MLTSIDIHQIRLLMTYLFVLSILSTVNSFMQSTVPSSCTNVNIMLKTTKSLSVGYGVAHLSVGVYPNLLPNMDNVG